jgi:hypothetical protein
MTLDSCLLFSFCATLRAARNLGASHNFFHIWLLLEPTHLGYEMLWFYGEQLIYFRCAQLEFSYSVNVFGVAGLKVKLFLCLIGHGIFKTFRGSGDIAPRILILGIVWRWVVSVMPRSFAVVEWGPIAHWIGRYIGSGVGVNAEDKKEVLCPCPPSIPVLPVVTTGLPTEFLRLIVWLVAC